MSNAPSPPQSPDLDHREDVGALAGGAVFTLAGRIFGRATHLLTQIVLARGLGPATFGMYTLGWTILRLSAEFAPAGLQNGIIHFGARAASSRSRLNQIVRMSLGLSIAFGLAVGALLWFAAPIVATRVFETPGFASVMRIFAVALPLAAFMKVAAAGTRITQRMARSVVIEDISQPVSNLILVGICIAAGAGVLCTTAAASASFAIAAVVGCSLVSRFRPLPGNTGAGPPSVGPRALLAYSAPTAVAATLGSLILWTDRLFLGAMRTSTDVGVYQAATQVAMLFLVVMGAVAAIFTPMIARLYHEKEFERLSVLYRISTKWTLYLCLPIAVLVFARPSNVITAIFGPEYAAAAVPVMILAAAQLINVGTGSVGYLLIMTGRQRAWMSVSAISFALNLVLNAALIPRWGATGAAIATGVAVSVLFMSGLVLVVRLIGMWPYDFSYAKGLVAFGAATVACGWYQVPTTVGGVSVAFLISAGVFAGTLWLLGLTNEDRQLIGIALERARLR